MADQYDGGHWLDIMNPVPNMADVRAKANRFLDTAVTIQRATMTPDAYGSATKNWNTIATTMGLFTKPTGSYMQNIAERQTSAKIWQVSLPIGVSVLPGDHLVTSTDTLTVQNILTPESYAVYQNLFASEDK